MVTYRDVLDAADMYNKMSDKQNWDNLWIICQKRMSALVKTRAKLLPIRLDPEDLDGIIEDATIRVMVSLKNTQKIDEDYISATFWFECKSTIRDFNRSMKRWQRSKDFRL